MRALLALALALPATALAGGPLVTVDGSCPGPVVFDMIGLTPGGLVAVVAGPDDGSAPIPAGPCAGVDTGLSAPLRWSAPFRADGTGSATLTPNVPDVACDMHFAVVDVSSCFVSPTETFGGGGGMGGDFAGYIEWSQTADSQSDVDQDAIMDSECNAVFPGSRAATVEEIAMGAIVGLPATNDSGRHLVGACPSCEGLDHPSCVDGHARNCVNPGASFPGVLPPDASWNPNCHTSVRSAACVF